MVDLVTTWNGKALVPATKADIAALDRVRKGAPLGTKVIFRRSVVHNRWYRGLVGVVADGLGLHPDALHAELKSKAGLVRRILLGDAGPFVELESCAFATMDESAFREYVSLAIEIIFRDYLPGVRRGPVFKQVEAMVGPRPR
jgi:hypothetical protein